ncbi:Bug family tripartite tricarboxylate transporter substrate binding protein [Cupriavidus alkaliphilus]|uniref:Bug family tripartite tricarboxylate transporter substrate binding protein n=1 Tax=Cupriavidus alkaliphilus TaxID=942866 RepID=UPI000DC5967E|nr:tripartite tricarboxylate transporter substrate binding protein [Cupriavidus alkaliphilus]MBB2919991.1 tripartite-type tricarboxylate transporter receptor subunit TctC [Cupriavidus alkaliphilus]MBB3013271.1 tripartite-type tricarboxylate transporter receptor subunit TctC [Cupriavidus alkaliphilus]RAS03481.1 tripartite-type tricarboxylate transporter receptor subunit TctC [Cupriavidus alkaliphilus]
MKRLRVGHCLAAILLMLGAGTAAAQYPERAVKIIVSLPPGSGADTTARYIGQHLSQKFGQPFVVENKPGANSFIAAKQVAEAVPDGYTLFVASNSPMVTNAAVFKSLPYDPIKDFAPVARIARFPMVLAVPANSPYKTLDSLVDAARKAPGKLNYASGTPTYQVALELFHESRGIRATPIPYKGTSLAMADLAAGSVDYTMAEVSAVMPLVRGGKVRALAVSSPERLKDLPGVPTIAEAGSKGYETFAWTGVFLPAKAPQAVVDKLSQAVRELLMTQESTRFIETLGGSVFPGGPQQLRDFQLSEIDRTRRIVKTAGIHQE